MERNLFQDALTGIEQSQVRRYPHVELMGAFVDHEQPFGVLFVDIRDRFKAVNDHYGHGIGDKVIQLVARTLQNGLRPTDRVCRFGGEEFLCMLPSVDHEDLLQVAERLRMLVERAWLDTALGALRVTISLGGSLALSGDSPAALIERADKNMYMASRRAGTGRLSLLGRRLQCCRAGGDAARGRT